MTELKKGHSSCGACRTRESDTWWKAPKGLATNVLCDSCGLAWRKYADLNVRPIREDPLTKNNNKAGDKREGTPLNGNANKRAKVSRGLMLMPQRPLILRADCIVSGDPSSACGTSDPLCWMSAEWANWKGASVQAVPVPRSRRLLRNDT